MNERSLKQMAAAASLLLPGVALAHPGHTEAPALLAGMLHPFSGADHLLLMLGLGIWASMLPAGRRWVGPIAALLAMVLGVVWGAAGSGLPGLELLLAGSLLLMGGVLVSALRTAPLLTGLAVTVLAGLHGFAHGVEMVPGTSFWHYALGLSIASLALQITGMLLGRIARRRLGERTRLLGLPLLATGLWMMLGGA